MKKFLCVVALLLGICSLSAQEVEHLKFKGVPIDGTLEEFVERLEDVGFARITVSEGVGLLSGSFAGKHGCLLVTSLLKDRNLIHGVTVLFPEKETWSSLLFEYDELKLMLTQKYGDPVAVEEYFNDDYVAREETSDFLKLHALREGECSYRAKFEVPQGIIGLTLSHVEIVGYCVALSYLDGENSALALSSAIDDL